MRSETPPAVRLQGVRLHYGKVQALAGIDLDVPAGCMVGLIGPDGVGKSSLLSLIAGARKIQDGTVWVLGGDMRERSHRNRVCPRIAYMPQGLVDPGESAPLAVVQANAAEPDDRFALCWGCHEISSHPRPSRAGSAPVKPATGRWSPA